MISAYGDNENYRKAISSGAKEFFTKPIDFESRKKKWMSSSIKIKVKFSGVT